MGGRLVAIAAGVLALAIAGCSWMTGRDTPAAFDHRTLVDRSGFALYTYDRDVAYSGKSLCEGLCTEVFRPYLAAPGARRVGEFALIVRPQGERQWTYAGKPLYRYSKDSQPAQALGDGAEHLWRVVGR